MIALRLPPTAVSGFASGSMASPALLDEIRQKCELVLGDDFIDHCSAYLYLRRCPPFQRVLKRFHYRRMNLFDLAGLLAPGSVRLLGEAALQMLAEELTDEAAARMARPQSDGTGAELQEVGTPCQ